MRRKWKFILIASLAVILGLVAAHRIIESPSRVLRRALHLERLPSSVTNLRMGSDVWTDEVRGFYFEIAPDDFPLLLTGRRFESIETFGGIETRTLHITPPITFMAHGHYRYETDGFRIEAFTNDKKNRVIAISSAD